MTDVMAYSPQPFSLSDSWVDLGSPPSCGHQARLTPPGSLTQVQTAAMIEDLTKSFVMMREQQAASQKDAPAVVLTTKKDEKEATAPVASKKSDTESRSIADSLTESSFFVVPSDDDELQSELQSLSKDEGTTVFVAPSDVQDELSELATPKKQETKPLPNVALDLEEAVVVTTPKSETKPNVEQSGYFTWLTGWFGGTTEVVDLGENLADDTTEEADTPIVTVLDSKALATVDEDYVPAVKLETKPLPNVADSLTESTFFMVPESDPDLEAELESFVLVSGQGPTTDEVVATFHNIDDKDVASDEEVLDMEIDAMGFEKIPAENTVVKHVKLFLGIHPSLHSDSAEQPGEAINVMPTRQEVLSFKRGLQSLVEGVVRHIPVIGHNLETGVQKAGKVVEGDINFVADKHEVVATKVQGFFSTVSDAFRTSYWNVVGQHYGMLPPEVYAEGPRHVSLQERAADVARRYGPAAGAAFAAHYVGLGTRGAVVAGMGAGNTMDEQTGDLLFAAGVAGAPVGGLGRAAGVAIDLQAPSLFKRAVNYVVMNQKTVDYVVVPTQIVVGAFRNLLGAGKEALAAHRFEHQELPEWEMMDDDGQDVGHLAGYDDRSYVRQGYDAAVWRTRPIVNAAGTGAQALSDGVVEYGPTVAKVGALATLGAFCSWPVTLVAGVIANDPARARARLGAWGAQIASPVISAVTFPARFIPVPGAGLLARFGARQALQTEAGQNAAMTGFVGAAATATGAASKGLKLWSWFSFRSEQSRRAEEFRNLERY